MVTVGRGCRLSWLLWEGVVGVINCYRQGYCGKGL